MGWNEIDHAMAVSERSKRPVAEVLERRRGGESWQDISERSAGHRPGPASGAAG